MLTFVKMLDIGLDRLIDLALRDQLTPVTIWTAVRGGWRYVGALATGDEAPADIVTERMKICLRCPARDESDTYKPTVGAVYCGTGQPIDSQPTCGCLVAIRINGTPYPAGKSLVASESCPRQAWLSVGNRAQPERV